jgi:hypothetical protein
MRHFNQGRFRQQLLFLRRQFLQDGDLPFSNVLSEEIVAQALTAINVFWKDRIFSPLVTLWVFLGQVLSADSCCRAAVARLIAHRLSQGQSPCSPETGAYCQARKRLPEKFFSDVARQTGCALEANVDPQWLWKRRRVYVYDGSTVSMPDTPKNQSEYPQPIVQKPGLGFPLARIAAVFSLASGAVLDVGIARMSVPPIYNLRELGPQAQQMAKNCNNERLAMTLQYVAIGSMILMATATAAHLFKDLVRNTDHHGRSK